MGGLETDAWATQHGVKRQPAYDAGREAMGLAACLFAGLLFVFIYYEVAWLSTWTKAAIVIVAPSVLALIVMRFIGSAKRRNKEIEATRTREEDARLQQAQITEARTRGDFDRWKNDE